MGFFFLGHRVSVNIAYLKVKGWDKGVQHNEDTNICGSKFGIAGAQGRGNSYRRPHASAHYKHRDNTHLGTSYL